MKKCENLTNLRIWLGFNGFLEKNRAEMRTEQDDFKKAKPSCEPSQAKTARTEPRNEPSQMPDLCINKSQ
jgi:hypothetical protein